MGDECNVWLGGLCGKLKSKRLRITGPLFNPTCPNNVAFKNVEIDIKLGCVVRVFMGSLVGLFVLNHYLRTNKLGLSNRHSNF